MSINEEINGMIGHFLKRNVWLEVDQETKSVYTGGLDGSDKLYQDRTHINIRLLADIEGKKSKSVR